MKKYMLKISLGIIASVFGLSVNAQCPAITCPTNITVNNDNNTCDAIVNFTAPIGNDPCASFSQTFSPTGAQQTWLVPSGITLITVDAYGAQGGANWVNNTNFGGRVQADVPVIPGSTIYIYVGEQPSALAGGFNGGGTGEGAGIGGGGASDIRIGGATLNDRVIVAAGAGGAGYWASEHVVGGVGGGLIGGDGYRNTAGNPGGAGGTQTATGNGTCASFNNPIVAGGFGFGGSSISCGCEGYGGGGGWYGGGGSGNCRGGGGGSSYTLPAATNVIHTSGARTGHGEITISYGAPVPTTQTAGLPSGAPFPIGTTTNTFSATNAFGTVTCSFTVTVVDTTSPTITCPGNTTSCDTIVNGIAPTATTDNCVGEYVTYTLTGATAGSGVDDASGSTFNVGTTTVQYTVTDSAGNNDSCSFDVLVHPATAVSIVAFNPDTICLTDALFDLPVGAPVGGTYSGPSVVDTTFNPNTAGTGAHYVVYTITDANNCTFSDSTMIVVDGCVSIDENNSLSSVDIYPNPTNGLITIDLGSSNDAINFTISTIEGRIVNQASNVTSNQMTVNLSNESKGIYFLKIENNTSSMVYKIIRK
jgi:hypothetical protein